MTKNVISVCDECQMQSRSHALSLKQNAFLEVTFKHGTGNVTFPSIITYINLPACRSLFLQKFIRRQGVLVSLRSRYSIGSEFKYLAVSRTSCHGIVSAEGNWHFFSHHSQITIHIPGISHVALHRLNIW